jgi:hypothetical protein
LLERLDALARRLWLRPDCLALLALGSAGAARDRLDPWSDLDFFVVVRDGAKERFLSNLDWLSEAQPVVWHFRNTIDGHKALMQDGVFCEFAVFERAELPRIPYAPGRFVWRRPEVDEALAAPTAPLPARHHPQWLLGEALSNLIVGLSRHARGEKLSAMRLIQVHALDRLLELRELQEPQGRGLPPPLAARDPFQVDRRVEARTAAAPADFAAWAGGYEQSVPAALAILQALEAEWPVPPEVSSHVRALAAASQLAS